MPSRFSSFCYSTVNRTVVVCCSDAPVTLVDVAVTVSVYVCGAWPKNPLLAPQPLRNIVAVAVPSMRSSVAVRRVKRLADFLRLVKSGNRSRPKAIVPPTSAPLCSIASALVCTVIVILAGALFSVTEEGLKVAVAPGGRPVTLKVMGLVNGVGFGVRVNRKDAALPGEVVTDPEVGPGLMLKSGATTTTSLSAVEVLAVKLVEAA